MKTFDVQLDEYQMNALLALLEECCHEDVGYLEAMGLDHCLLGYNSLYENLQQIISCDNDEERKD